MAYVYLTLPDVRELAQVNPQSTAFMRLRVEEAALDGKTARRVQKWVPYSRISSNLKRAVLVAEDDAFFEHEGVDFEQIKASIEADLTRGRAMRGASTITQQLAKNLYLSPSRDPLRKLREWILARRLEAALPKARIFEIYLNVIEWGDGIWGAEAAARTYFGTSAAALSPSQAALLAGAIINPRVYSPARPNTRLLNRQKIILARMGGVTPPAPVQAAEPSAIPEESPIVGPDDEPSPSEDVVPAEHVDEASADPITPVAPSAPLTPSAQ